MSATDSKAIPVKNAALRITFPIVDADGDLVTAAAGLDSEVSIDGGTFADCISEAVEIATASGMYYLDLTAAEMNGDTIAIIVKTSTSGAKTTPIVLYTAARSINDLAFPATSGRSLAVEADGMVYSDLREWLGVAPLALLTQLVQAQANQLATQAKADVNAEADTALTDYDPPTKAEMDAGHALLATPAQVNTEVDNALDTAIPGLPTANSINERVKAIDDKLPSSTYLKGSADADGGMDTADKADVNAEVVDALGVDTIPELAQAPPTATPTIKTALMLHYMALRNKLDVDTAFKEIHNDAGVVICKKALTDTGSVYSEAEAETGP